MMIIINVLIVLLLCCQPQSALPQFDQQPEAPVELDVLSCPLSCVCQYAAFNELPIARWVNYMTSAEEGPDDSDFPLTTHIKLATCLLQEASETLALLSALPIDLQALVLLHTGSPDSQLTVNTSSLRFLNQLSTLEIRGTGATTLIIDEPLELLQHANFEQIRLQASERLQRPKHSKLPSDDYEYKPPSDVAGNEATPKNQLQFEADATVEIMSYEQHVERLKQTRMPSFWGWNLLEVLRIHNCQLNELHWQMFDGLPQLHHLNLERNDIEEVQPFAFSGAPRLRSLSLAHNAVSRLYYLGLAGLLELETLNLADNHLERLSESSFPPLPRLQKADLRQNPIKYILPATFWVMNDTLELQLGSELAALKLHSWNSYGQFDSLHKLRTLSLTNVTTPSLEQGVFKGLQALEQLTLRGRIGSVQFDAFAGMEQLRELDMSHCGIAELSMDALLGVKRLELLNLAHNNLTHVPNGLLDDQQQLVVVQLQGNQLRTLPTSFFHQPRLRVARLDQNPWQCNCDMSNWLPRLTNVVRGPSVERCVHDIDGKPILCRHVVSYKMDKNLVPRCANFNGRSVYYVLRKQLHCGAPLILTPSRSGNTRGLPHWLKLELQQHRQQQQQHQKQGSSNKKQSLKRQRKGHLSQRNRLDYILRQKQQQRNEEFSQETEDKQMSNEI
ncbi:leucine-rich repeat-containing G-protein coupled receptor 5-like [Drosophila novamexicana]|uniref:leucine-rich repeat-containing G-protein coupled receptor 5-like n=1 Tax=Drosophila novamexicana TaxID=47314 RepID=UPI0011E5AE7C|nr:leucine-rich repeat-containing G-protein coupled receptor 5-like [Drosophila novamexicana]